MRLTATTWLILSNISIFATQFISVDRLLTHFALWPIGHFYNAELHETVGFHLWQPFTSAFLHGGPAHLFLNMLALYMFGRDVERTLGTRAYLRMYAAAVLSAALVQLLVMSLDSSGEPHPAVGASGGVFGVLLAFGVLFPRRRLVLLFPPIAVEAWLFVLMYGGLELVSGMLGMSMGVAHFAHLGGMLGAYLVLRRWRSSTA